jgi:hypothetical protein
MALFYLKFIGQHPGRLNPDPAAEQPTPGILADTARNTCMTLFLLYI